MISRWLWKWSNTARKHSQPQRLASSSAWTVVQISKSPTPSLSLPSTSLQQTATMITTPPQIWPPLRLERKPTPRTRLRWSRSLGRSTWMPITSGGIQVPIWATSSIWIWLKISTITRKSSTNEQWRLCMM